MSALDEIKKKLDGKPMETVKSFSEAKSVSEKKKSRGGRNYVPNGKGHGISPGRPPNDATVINRNFKMWLNDFMLGDEWTQIREFDGKGVPTGKILTVKKTRVMKAIQKLYEIGQKGEGNVAAIQLLFDRYLGKLANPIKGEGEDDAPIKLQVTSLPEMLKKAYGNPDD